MRTVRLAFESSGRIARLSKEEGDRVRAGEVIGELDRERLLIERDKAAAEERRLDATLEEFEARGFSEARIEDIARRAGVALGTVYNYFESKEALLMGLADEFSSFMQDRIAQGLRSGRTLRGQVEFLVEPLLAENGCGRRSRVLRVIWSEGLHRPELTRPIFEKFLLPIFAPDGPMSDLVRDSGTPEVVKTHPILLAAPILQGIMWQILAGAVRPIDLRAVYSGYLDAMIGRNEATEKSPLHGVNPSEAAPASEMKSEKPGGRRFGQSRRKAPTKG